MHELQQKRVEVSTICHTEKKVRHFTCRDLMLTYANCGYASPNKLKLVEIKPNIERFQIILIQIRFALYDVSSGEVVRSWRAKIGKWGVQYKEKLDFRSRVCNNKKRNF